MPRPLLLLVAFSLFSANLYGQEARPSPAVKRILDKAVGKVRANRTEFDKANKKPLDDARAELQDLSTKLIKDGKTEEAGVVLKQVGTLEADVMRQANAPAPMAGGGGRATPQRPVLERLAGRWDASGSQVATICDAQGGFKEVHKSDGRLHVEGTVRPTGEDTAEAKCTNGWSYRYRFIEEDILLVRFYGEDGREPFEAMLKFRSK